MSYAEKTKANSHTDAEDFTLILRGDNVQPQDIILGSLNGDAAMKIAGVQRMRHGEWHVTLKDEGSYHETEG
jgi:hypothetical protein